LLRHTRPLSQAELAVTSANLTLEEYAKAAQVGESVGFQRSWLEDDERDLTEEVTGLPAADQ